MRTEGLATDLLQTGFCCSPVSCSKCSAGNKIQRFSWSSRRINFKILSQKQPLKHKFTKLAQSLSSIPGQHFSTLLAPLLYHLHSQSFTLPQTYLYQKDERTHFMFFPTNSVSIPPPLPPPNFISQLSFSHCINSVVILSDNFLCPFCRYSAARGLSAEWTTLIR
jgi:hypothetical protein